MIFVWAKVILLIFLHSHSGQFFISDKRGGYFNKNSDIGDKELPLGLIANSSAPTLK